jgi:hypothetical protein
MGQPILVFTLAQLGIYGALAITGKYKELGHFTTTVGALCLVVIGCRIAGAVQFAQFYAAGPIVEYIPVPFTVGEGFNHSTVCMLSISVLIALKPICKQRGRSYSGVIKKVQDSCKCHKDSYDRGDIMAKYKDPYYLAWYFTCLALLPMVWARHVYSALSTYVTNINWPFFPVSPRVGAIAGLAFVPEAVIVAALLLVGWKLPEGPTVTITTKTVTASSFEFVSMSPTATSQTGRQDDVASTNGHTATHNAVGKMEVGSTTDS